MQTTARLRILSCVAAAAITSALPWAEHVDANPVVIDIDKVTGQRDPAKLRKAMHSLFAGTDIQATMRAIRGKDEANQYDDSLGWIPITALLRERNAIREGVLQVQALGPIQACVGLERGGGFLADVLTAMPAPLACATVDKATDRADKAATQDRTLPRGKAKQLVNKIRDQAELDKALKSKAGTTVIVDSMVSGDSLAYTMETIEQVLASTANTKIILLAVRDGSRIPWENYVRQEPVYCYGGCAREIAFPDPWDPNTTIRKQPEEPNNGLDGWASWFKKYDDHVEPGHDHAALLAKTYKGRFHLIIVNAWYLVGEDVYEQLLKTNNGKGHRLVFWSAFTRNGDVTIAPDPDKPAKVWPQVKAWSFVPPTNTSLRAALVGFVASPDTLIENMPERHGVTSGELTAATQVPGKTDEYALTISIGRMMRPALSSSVAVIVPGEAPVTLTGTYAATVHAPLQNGRRPMTVVVKSPQPIALPTLPVEVTVRFPATFDPQANTQKEEITNTRTAEDLPPGKMLCVFDVDRTLTADQTSGKNCSTAIDQKAMDYGHYEKSPAPLRQAAYAEQAFARCLANGGVVGIATAASGCSQGKLDSVADKFMWLNLLIPWKTAELPRAEDLTMWAEGEPHRPAPYHCACFDKRSCVESIRAFYTSMGVDIDRTYFFDDDITHVTNVSKLNDVVAKQVSCYDQRAPKESCGKNPLCCGISQSEFELALNKPAGVYACGQ